MSEWFARYPNDNGEYEITFRGKHEQAKAVEKVCHAIIDKTVSGEEDIELVKEKFTIHKVLKALSDLCWYNGWSDYYLLPIKEEIENTTTDVYRPDNTKWESDFRDSIWMILVLLFGSYGTSPRGGWLEMEHKDDILVFIDCLLRTYEDSFGYF